MAERVTERWERVGSCHGGEGEGERELMKIENVKKRGFGVLSEF